MWIAVALWCLATSGTPAGAGKLRFYALAILCFFSILNASTAAQAGECPTSASDIATDRPDVTNSSLVVLVGSLHGGDVSFRFDRLFRTFARCARSNDQSHAPGFPYLSDCNGARDCCISPRDRLSR
jgi:hypothetical protein